MATARLQCDEQLAQMECLVSELTPYRELVSHHFSDMESLVSSFRDGIQKDRKEGRKLTVGIVGQVKAGKSSLLNALLFEGEDVLPKAATPMTAALTVISHDSKTRAEVEFYSELEWQSILELDKEYSSLIAATKQNLASNSQAAGNLVNDALRLEQLTNLPVEVLAAHQLVEMVKESDLDVNRYLGKKEEIQGVTCPTELKDRMIEYVGAGGKYTPLVRSSSIFYDNSELEELEIVDTPGMNDPVVSRSRRTKEYLGQCDVIFLLSLCSSFMDENDLRLLVSHIPSYGQGIEDILVIGSQIDEPLVGSSDDNRNRIHDVESLLSMSVEKYTNSLKDRVQAKLKRCEDEIQRQLLNRILDSCIERNDAIVSPVFISAMAFKIAMRLDDLDEEERTTLDILNSLYPPRTFDKDLLLALANIDQIRDALEQYRQNKEKILEGRLDKRCAEAQEQFICKRKELSKFVTSRIERLKSEDVSRLRENARDATNRLIRGQSAIEEAFDTAAQNMKLRFNALLNELERDSLRFGKLDVRTETQTVSYEVSSSTWYKPWTWGSTRTKYRTITTRYASVNDAVDQVEEYLLHAKQGITISVNTIINRPEFQKTVREATLKLFDLNNPDNTFNIEDDIILPVERAISKIVIPEFDLGNRDYTELISSQFSGSQVKNDDVDQLQESQRKALKLVFDELSAVVTAEIPRTTIIIDSIKSEFVSDLINDMQNNLETIEKELADIEATIGKYQNALKVLECV